MQRHCYLLLFIAWCLAVFSSCSTPKKISIQAKTILLTDTAIRTGHISISIYDAGKKKILYNHNADKFFVPASNTKLFTLYAGMKYLGDSLVGLRYRYKGSTDSIDIYPTADPTFLHPDFPKQPVLDLLRKTKYIDYHSQYFTDQLGSGWAWDDYQHDYMAQRSEMPMYGNLIRIYASRSVVKTVPAGIQINITPAENYNDSLGYTAFREWQENKVILTPNYLPNKLIKLPIAAGLYDMPRFLMDTLHNQMGFPHQEKYRNRDVKLSVIYSQPSDSLFKPMMFNSDNFLAEQTLLMVSNERLGEMNDEKIIDSLLRSDLAGVPQKPRWVDGSGLSRYNLFTAHDFIYILEKMKNEFGMSRLMAILPTGGQGSLKNYFLKDSSFIYAKTGSMSNNAALSGFLVTKKGKLLIFSILANNYQASLATVRIAMEKFLEAVRDKN